METEKLTVILNQEDMCKLERRAAKIGMSASEAAHVIFTKGVPFFLSLLVGATNCPKT